MEKKYSAYIVVGAVILAVISFYGGEVYAKYKVSSSFRSGQMMGNRQGGFSGGQQGNRFRSSMGGFIAGTILSKDAQTITISLPDGSSKIVLIGESTQVSKFTPGTDNDLTLGTSVMVMGAPNSDGSITAQSVQIRPASSNGTSTAPQVK